MNRSEAIRRLDNAFWSHRLESQRATAELARMIVRTDGDLDEASVALAENELRLAAERVRMARVQLEAIEPRQKGGYS